MGADGRKAGPARWTGRRLAAPHHHRPIFPFPILSLPAYSVTVSEMSARLITISVQPKNSDATSGALLLHSRSLCIASSLVPCVSPEELMREFALHVANADPTASVRAYVATDSKAPSGVVVLSGATDNSLDTSAVEVAARGLGRFDHLEVRNYSLISDTGSPAVTSPIMAWAAITPKAGEEQEFNSWFVQVVLLEPFCLEVADSNAPGATGTMMSISSMSRTYV